MAELTLFLQKLIGAVAWSVLASFAIGLYWSAWDGRLADDPDYKKLPD